MRQLFGDAFADEFLTIATSGKAQREVIYWPAGTGPTDEQLRALHYHRGGREITGSGWIEVEVWVHPAGKLLRRGLSEQSLAATPESPPPTLTDEQERALEWLERMRKANDRVGDECSSAAFDAETAEDAMSDFMTARMHLQMLRNAHVDMSAIDAGFWQQFEREEDENALMRKPCCEREPDNIFFRCPIDQVTPRWPRRP